MRPAIAPHIRPRLPGFALPPPTVTIPPMLRLWLILPLLPLLASCEHPHPAPGTHPTVASAVPGATDLILGMGAQDHLVAISNFDSAPQLASLPRVGDYQTIDWEKIAQIRPDLMIVFMAHDRVPPALDERARQLRIKLLNVHTERLADVYRELDRLGRAIAEPAKAAAAAQQLRSRLETVRNRVAGQDRPRVILAREANPQAVVGTQNFLNDILEIAGGQNAIQTPSWPNLDQEQLIAAHPDIVILLLPGVSPQVRAQALESWQRMGELPAVKSGRVYVIDDPWAQQPGLHLADLAEKIARILHGGRS